MAQPEAVLIWVIHSPMQILKHGFESKQFTCERIPGNTNRNEGRKEGRQAGR